MRHLPNLLVCRQRWAPGAWVVRWDVSGEQRHLTTSFHPIRPLRWLLCYSNNQLPSDPAPPLAALLLRVSFCRTGFYDVAAGLRAVTSAPTEACDMFLISFD